MNSSTSSALDKLIQQISAIFPTLGEGYIEAALACYSHDIERTTNALMESEVDPKSLHPRLRSLDKSLPARRKESKKKYDLLGSVSGNRNAVDDNNEIDKEERKAMEIQKARIKEMEIAQEEEAYKLGIAMAMNDIEYNDDYDDQYDGIGDDGGATGGIGGADSGLYDFDFESIRTYNKIAREVESDRLFWEENRNTNRSSQKNSGGSDKKKKKKKVDDEDDGNTQGNNGGSELSECEDDDDGDVNQKKYKGPDKGKGGRIIGPDGKYLPHPKSRKKANKAHQRSSNNTSTPGNTKNDGTKSNNNQQLSKIQKRRKNDNKAKIANHHRKERALKKGVI